MKVKNLRLKNKSILYGNKTIDFDNEGISAELTEEEVKELTSLPFFEEVRGIVEESKDIKKKGKAKKESK